MRMRSLGVRLRRGAWGEGSRAARALAAACLAAVAIALLLPSTAAAYPCGERRVPAAHARTLMSAAVSTDECRAPEQGRTTEPARTRKRGDMTGLTVFVLALGAALLIPIGRKGLPHGGDPFGHDPVLERPTPGNR
jgi:hypothetical protein